MGVGPMSKNCVDASIEVANEYNIPLNKKREVIINTLVINQKIGNTDLGRFDSLKNIIKNPTIKQAIVVA